MFYVILESTRSALISIFAHGLRSFLTTLGIVIGVASVIAVISLTQGMSAFIGESFSSLGSNSLTIQSYTPISEQMRGVRARLTPEDLELIERRAEGVASITPILYASRTSQVRYAAQTTFSQIMGTTYAYSDVSQSYMLLGRFIAESDNLTRRRVAVIGEKVREDLALPENPVNEYVELGGEWFKIIGLLEPKGDVMGFNQDDIVLVPYATMVSLQGNQARTDIQIQLSLSEDAEVEDVTRQLTALLRNAHDLGPEDDDDFIINTAEQLMQTFDTIINMVTLVIGGIVSISLLVGGIGVMNIMFVTVKERTKEIGIRKAVGANRNAILVQFLIEAVLVCMVAGLIGVGISLGVSAIINSFLPAYLSPFTVGLAFAICVGVGIVFGIVPSWNAASMRPIDALRYE